MPRKLIEVEIDGDPTHPYELAKVIADAVREYSETYDDVVDPTTVTIGDETYEG
jgi:hypothetical protein